MKLHFAGRAPSSLICIWHTGLLIAVDEQRSDCTPSITPGGQAFFARLHQRLSISRFFIVNRLERERRVRRPNNEVLMVTPRRPLVWESRKED
ncbi:hypothetical protein TNCV_2540271 [Trichonephila clavipes]|nr:hypothetical protein TNCV_2540271 [Trichonephila clavipes]